MQKLNLLRMRWNSIRIFSSLNYSNYVWITHRFRLEKAAEAYALMASGKCGKVVVVFDEEVR